MNQNGIMQSKKSAAKQVTQPIIIAICSVLNFAFSSKKLQLLIADANLA